MPETTYSLFVEFAEIEAVETVAHADEAVQVVGELDQVITELANEGVTLRGAYDLTGFDAVGSVLVWLRASAVDDLQWALRQLQRTGLLGDLLVARSWVTVDLTEVVSEGGSWISIASAEDAPTPDAHADLAGSGIVEIGSDGDDGDEDDGDEDGNEDAAEADDAIAEVSLHGRLGIGPLRHLVIAEADDPEKLVGDPAELFGGSLVIVDDDPIVGRQVTSAELFEVLR